MNRGSFLSSSATLAALAAVPASAAESVPGGTHLAERSTDFDEAGFARIVGRPAKVRQLFEAVSFHAGLLNNVKNALNGLQFGYGYSGGDIAIAMCLHGASSAYNYSDYVWTKYRIGEFFKIAGADGATIASNVFLKPAKRLIATTNPDVEGGIDQDTSIRTLQGRGVIFLTCHTAVEEQARALVKKGFAPVGMTPMQVADDVLTHLIPGTHVVPSMVATVAVLQQRFHYAYTTVDFT